jgi:hypothetical protein
MVKEIKVIKKKFLMMLRRKIIILKIQIDAIIENLSFELNNV